VPLAAFSNIQRTEAMKFANKYELFEAVTSGRVETFVAKDLTSGERVLLHIFEAPEKKPDQPTVLWVLESFRNVAPDPAGLVLDTGRYSGTTYAYLVTKLPDGVALRNWAQSYDSFLRAAQETPSEAPAPGNPALGKDLSPPLDRPTKAPALSLKPPDDFTAAFSGLPPRVSPPPEVNSAKETALEAINSGSEPLAALREPGDFTKQFFSGLHKVPAGPGTQAPTPMPEVPRIKTETQATAKAEATEPQSAKPSSGGLTGKSAPAVSQDSGGFTALFQSSFKSEPKPASESAKPPSKSDDAKAGDFTDFFRGPFDGERPAETPNILPQVSDPPQRKPPGDFTRVFGSGTPPSQSSGGDILQQDKPGAFTQMFPNTNPSVSPLSTNPPLRTTEPLAPKSETPPPAKEPVWTPPPPLSAKAPVAPSIEPVFEKPAVRETEPPTPARATHVFSSAGRPVLSPPSSAGGPSEYTRIIEGGCLSPAGAVPIATPKVAPPPPKFSPPAAPPVPKLPKLEIKPPKPKAAYLPLVVILNVLLFVAILLIVYFAIKH
jgi:hypothetical protein